MIFEYILETIKAKITKPYYAFREKNSSKKVLHLKTVIPVIFEEKIPLKELRNQPLTFWDYENSSTYDVSELSGHIFVVGHLQSAHVENIMKLKEKNKNNAKIHLFDSNHTQKNYADILIASFVGEILQSCGTLKEVNFISKDKGFHSIKYFLETQGIENVRILNQTNAVSSKVETFKKIVQANYVTNRYISLRTILKTGKSLGISESDVYKILQDDYKFDYDYATDKVRLRYKT